MYLIARISFKDDINGQISRLQVDAERVNPVVWLLKHISNDQISIFKLNVISIKVKKCVELKQTKDMKDCSVRENSNRIYVRNLRHYNISAQSEELKLTGSQS